MALLQDLLLLLGQHRPLVLTLLGFLLPTVLYYTLFRSSAPAPVKAPRVGMTPWPLNLNLNKARLDFVKNGRALTKLGYEKYKNGMYWIQTGDMDRLVLPGRYIDELRKLPDTLIDSRIAVVERNLGWYNGVDLILTSVMHVHVCRTELVRYSANVTQNQIEDLPAVFEAGLGHELTKGASKAVKASAFCLSIVNQSVARVLVGAPLCYNPRWLANSLQLTVNGGMHSRALQRYPAIIRPLADKLLATRGILDRSYAECEALLTPAAATRKQGDENYDMLQWLIDNTKPEELDYHFLAKQVSFLAFASARSTAAALLQGLFDIISHEQCQPALRQEISDALQRHGGWSLAAINDMHKLDSFIKESQRLSNHLLLSFNRKVKRTTTLSDGLTLPAGTFISTPAYWMARDADHFPGGDEFHPWRWDELRQKAEAEGKSSTGFKSHATSPENLFWGYGKNACPGRFLASSEVKLMSAWILHYYEVTFPGAQKSAPEPSFLDERVFPNQEQEVVFRLRTA